MKFLRLLLKNVFRNRRRTFLTVTSIAVSLFLVATLRTVLTELQNPPETPESALRLITRHRVSLANILPIAYRDKIAKVEGVQAVIGSMWFGGVYKDPSNFFAQFAVNTDQFFEVNADIIIAEEHKQAFLEDRTGAIAGNNLADRFGWKIGDKIHLKGALFRFDPELTLRGVYEGGSDEGNTLFFHWDYFNEGMNNAAFTGTYSIKARSAEDVPRIADQVDALFQNSTAPTKTETEKAFLLGFVEMMGNVQFFITSICAVVIFAILLVAANTMAMSIRERVREIGVLKALGFRKLQILSLLLGESICLALGGALIGSWSARILYSGVSMAKVTGGMIQRFHVTPGTLLLCAAIGLLVGILSAGIPAWRASQRSVVDALRRVV
ncbi:FtsX-like permease family protein [Acidobacteria bacterium AH-259-A15]|nr:FtsX-like permease family protein [Acidobacteria bacterium AH-259-A15]